MSTISVVTPVHAENVQFLPAAYASLKAQTLPAGWTWEWCVQEDGDHVSATAQVPTNDPRIRVSASRRGGPHVARTMALARSSGSYVKVLDSDDQLTPGALARDLAALEGDAEIGWTTSRVTDLLEDGRTRSFELGDPQPGRLPRGSAYTFWSEHQRPQVHPASLCARRELVVLLGGWMALPASGDTGLLLGLDALTPGQFIGEVGLLYRKHGGQITNSPAHKEGEEWRARMSLIRERTEALHSWMSGKMPQ
ncbi:glycosyltransferase family 2 protein [Streptomyces rishiriensis]|uniref:Glycosyltransferase involved in cell wall biosynthesis n=1 Tax=Streptomyces rishiriensis TaxID=68264 RepID=A0ABU0NFP7_STRRH|nr:glycosyltransferase [Streptomyces rishiriensis]MDQ0577901.1 glycosyltransferase involved in cell wall biosynthesis [Streptomyces rishiriensis]